MSLVGNFTQSYDRQATVDGSGPGLTRSTSRAPYPPNEDDDVVATPIETRMEETRQLARQLTRISTRGAEDIFNYEADGPLDPNGPNFDARRWTRSMSQLSNMGRVSGVAFKDLRVHGYGSDAGESIDSIVQHTSHLPLPGRVRVA